MKILIGTPVAGDACKLGYADTLFRVARAFQAARPQVELVGPRFASSPDVVQARNALASLAFEDRSVTHLLMIDSDMGFRAQLLAKLIDADQPFVGTIYPRRLRLPDGTLPFVGEDDVVSAPVGGFVRARQVGTGILLVKREVLETLAAREPELVRPAAPFYAGFGLKRALHAFELMREQTGLMTGEDIAFCRRWTAAGGEIWACVDETIWHYGTAQA